MRFSVSFCAAALLALANAQSPAGFSPSVNRTLIAHYGTHNVTANETLSPVSSQPSIALNGTHNGTYFVALVDLSILDTQVRNQTNLTGALVPGLQANRTTRLHWLQTGLKQNTNGTFSSANGGVAIAPYAGPMPPAGDIAHTYAFYLFNQPAAGNITLTGVNAGKNYTAASTTARYDFNISSLVASYGAPVAANYFRVKNNSTSTGGGSSSNHTTTTTPVTTPGATSTSSSSSSTRSPGSAATPFAAAGLIGLAGVVALL